MNDLIKQASYWCLHAYGGDNQDHSHPTKYISCVHTDCQVLLVDLPSKYVVSFRGSDSLKDWGMNFTIKSASFMGGKVHGGFLKQYYSVRQDVLQYIKGDKDVLVCGHSLGGALACICARDLSPFRDVSCVTFGSPCVGNRAFHAGFRVFVPHAISICSRWDPVVRVPLRYNQAAAVGYVRGPWCNPHSMSFYRNATYVK